MFIFHGGCHGCTQQDEKGTEYCVGCCHFEPDWTLPNLSNKPPSPADRERERIKRKLGIGDSNDNQNSDFISRMRQILDQI